MLGKLTNLIGDLLAWLEQATVVHAMVLASVIAYLRVLYDGKETRSVRILLEASICGLLTLACFGLVRWLGWPDFIGTTLGGFIGFIGVDQLRALLLKRLNKALR